MLRNNLITASLYIAAFELLKETIVERIRDFFLLGRDESDPQFLTEYKSDVLSKNRSPVYSSLLWMRELKAIDESDIASFEAAKDCRNVIAHEMNRMLTDGLPAEWSECFGSMVALLDKIEKWWIVEVEIPSNSDFDDQEIEMDDILPGRIAGLHMMLDIALGSDEESQFYLDEFNRRIRQV